MSAPTKFTIGAKHTHNTMELTPPPTQVTIGAMYTHNSMDTDKEIARRKMVESNLMMMEMRLLLHLII